MRRQRINVCVEIGRNRSQDICFANKLTAASISAAGVSVDRVTMAAMDFLSPPAAFVDCRILTFSTVRFGGIRAFTTAGDVPGGRFESRKVGLATAFSSAKSRARASASSSLVSNTLDTPFGFDRTPLSLLSS